jgi:hypothetical protein
MYNARHNINTRFKKSHFFKLWNFNMLNQKFMEKIDFPCWKAKFTVRI